MKKFFSYFMMAMCLLGTSVVTSCGSDDDDDALADLPYEADAAIYKLDLNADRITYIELTTAGNYFIEYETMVKSKAAKISSRNASTPFITHFSRFISSRMRSGPHCSMRCQHL